MKPAPLRQPRPLPSSPAVLTERRGNVLLITINRPAVRNAVNAAVAAGWRTRWRSSTPTSPGGRDPHRRRGVLLRRDGSGRVRQGRVALVWRPRLRRHRPARLAQAADRGDRGLRRGRRHGDRAGLRPDRRRERRQARDSRGQALAGGRRRRAAAPAPADALPRGHGAGAHRRSAACRALSRASASSTAWPSPAAPSRRAGAGRTLAKNGPLALVASKRILQEQFDWSTEEMWERQAAISGPVFASEDAKEGANAFKEKRRRCGEGGRAAGSEVCLSRVGSGTRVIRAGDRSPGQEVGPRAGTVR